MTLASSPDYDYQGAFESMYKAEFGFLIEGKAVMVDDVRVRGIGRTFDSLGESVHAELRKTAFSSQGVSAKAEDERANMYFDQTGRIDAPVYMLDNLDAGDKVEGPAAIVDGTATIILDPGSEAMICSRHIFIQLS